MVFTSPPRIPSRRVWKRLAFQEEILQKCVRKTPLWRTTTTLSNKVVLQRINWGARQQHCYCHTWDVQKKCRNSNEVVVAMSKQRRWKKESHCCRGFFLTLWILFFRLLYFFQTILFWWWCNRRATTQQTLLTSCIIKICSHYATSLMVSVRGILTTKWWHSCMGISLFCSNNYNDHLLDFISTSSTIIDTKGLNFKSCYKLTNIWCFIKKVSFLKSLT